MSEPITTKIKLFRKDAILSCDGKCEKAWGINNRPRKNFDDDDPDDYAFLADDELGVAPQDPGTYEGGHGKPGNRCHNKWCTRECERSTINDSPSTVETKDFTKRVYNQPWKHKDR